MNNLHAWLLVIVIAIVTICTRFLPFWVIRDDKQTPEFINYLGKVLPYAIMGMLVVFCLKGVSLVQAPYGIPECLACLVVVGLHIWKRNTSLSIICGTICYMFLVQKIF